MSKFTSIGIVAGTFAIGMIGLSVPVPMSGQGARVTDRTVGYNWWLPEWVQPLPGTGFIMVDEDWINRWEKIYPLASDDANELFYTTKIGFTWNEVNPMPGVYHWETLDSIVDDIADTPHLGFGFDVGVYCAFSREDYVLNKDIKGLPDGPFRMVPEFVHVHYFSNGLPAGWDRDSDYLEQLEKFILRLGDRYKNHPRFSYCRIGVMDRSFGEGKFRYLNKDIYQEAVTRTGLRPASYLDFLRSMADIYAKGFRGQKRRVIWTNWDSENILMRYDSAYHQAKIESWTYALHAGLGGRDGQVENYLRYLSPGYGNYLDEDGYLIMDHHYPPIEEQRIWFTENENMGPGLGSEELVPYRFHASVLRLLQMHRNWYWVPFKEFPGHDTEFRFHELTRYSQLTMGRLPDNSPDAWCWLRLEWCSGYSLGLYTRNEREVKNMERWVIQRDIPDGGMTEPAVRKDLSGLRLFALERDYAYVARRTDHATGNHAIFFKIDPDFYGSYEGNLKLIITYHDLNHAEWIVEYQGESGMERSESVSTSDSGEVRSITIDIPYLKAGGSLAQGMDFRIRRLAGGDAVIELVRLIKTEA